MPAAPPPPAVRAGPAAAPAPPPPSTVEPWGGSAAPLPPMPPTDAPPSVPARRPSRAVVVVVVVVVALVGTGAVALLLSRGDGGGFPGEIGGIPRMETAEAKGFERLLDGTTIGGVSLSGAMYGRGDTPDLVVEVFSEVPAESFDVPMDAFFASMSTVLAGAISEEETVAATDGDVEYRCAPMEAGVPGFSGTGVMCLWRGDDLGIVITTRTQDAATAVGDARLVHDALAA